MPIRPDKRHLYPPRQEWLAIRAEVLAREGNKCQECGVPNYALVIWREDGTWDDVGELVRVDPSGRPPEGVTRIVLTISHTDHDPGNNGTPGNRPNLKPLCQRHHLAHDLPHHLANSRETRERKAGQTNLFKEGQSDGQ